MRNDPERFVTFVLGSFVLLFYMIGGVQLARMRQKLGKSPIAAWNRGAWERAWLLFAALHPLVVLAWAYNPAWYRWLPEIGAMKILPVRLLGLLCLCAAAAILVTAFAELGEAWRIGTDPASRAPLVQTGIYGSIRHPIYAAMLLWLAGIALMAPNALFFLLALAGAALVFIEAAHEEKFLLEKYGDEYRRYMARTRRFF